MRRRPAGAIGIGLVLTLGAGCSAGNDEPIPRLNLGMGQQYDLTKPQVCRKLRATLLGALSVNDDLYHTSAFEIDKPEAFAQNGKGVLQCSYMQNNVPGNTQYDASQPNRVEVELVFDDGTEGPAVVRQTGINSFVLSNHAEAVVYDQADTPSPAAVIERPIAEQLCPGSYVEPTVFAFTPPHEDAGTTQVKCAL